MHMGCLQNKHFLRRHIWCYTVCLGPIKRTPGLTELSLCNSCEHIAQKVDASRDIDNKAHNKIFTVKVHED